MMSNRKFAPPSHVIWGDRVNWVDTAKALGLFLVFWGHVLYGGSPVGSVINRAIYSFHMPMYFILSGYVLKPDSSTLGDFIKKKFRRLLLPAVLLYLITLPVYFCTLDYSTETPNMIIERIFYLNGRCAYNTPIWFFFCLFQLLFFVKLLDLSNASSKIIFAVAVVTLTLSFIIYQSDSNFLSILGLNKCLLSLFFYTFGMILRRTRYEDYKIIIGGIAFILWLFAGVILNTKCSMYGMSLGNFWLFILSGVTGSFVFFAICKFINCEMIRKYAKWTVFIVCTHIVLATLFLGLASLISLKGTFFFEVVSICYVLVALYFYKYLCSIVEKKLPVLIGK